jgi:hypothetical protein
MLVTKIKCFSELLAAAAPVLNVLKPTGYLTEQQV